MKSRVIFFYTVMFAFLNVTLAQNRVFDPLLDRNVKVLEALDRKSSGEYMWYPGQLSAHLQQKRLKESRERCVNVGYPGKFYAPANTTSFRKELNFSKKTTIEWKSTGQVKIIVNGQVFANTGNSLQLPRGKSSLVFVVETVNDLPSIRVSFNGQVSVDGWKVSLNGSEWNFAETSPVFGTAGRMPLEDPEIAVEIKPASVLPLQNAVMENQKMKISPNGSALVDFSHLEVGNVSFTAKGKGKLTVFVGETSKEALNLNTKSFEQYAIEPYSLSETETQIILPERAIRYVRICSDEGCEISDVLFKAKIWPVSFLMSFECNDQRINTIWNASVATLHTSTHGFYLDGIKRDYLPWSMDAVLSTFGGDYLFGDEQVSRNSLSVALLPLHPQKSDLGIPDYPLHAIIGFDHYYKRYGDFKTILSYRDRIEQLLKFYETLQDERGFISANVGSSWGFIPGWATKRGPDKKGIPTYAQIMLYLNFKIGADFSEKWGDKKSARHYRTKAETLRKNIMSHFWDEQQGLFVNGYSQKGELDKVISHHAQYWAILADIFPKNRWDNLFEILPKIPYYKDFVSYEKGYEFLAYAKAGKVRQMWNFLFDVFSNWLEQGHTRFPENFSYKKTLDEQLVFYNRPFGLSLCHGANGVPGVVAVLNGIAGFSQFDSNPNHYTIQPDLMDLEWANIEFPVKEGKIKLKLSKVGKNVIEIPKGCKVDFIDIQGRRTTLSEKGVYTL
jgi:hypothetical protein